MSTRGKITSPRMVLIALGCWLPEGVARGQSTPSEGEGFSQGCSCQLDLTSPKCTNLLRPRQLWHKSKACQARPQALHHTSGIRGSNTWAAWHLVDSCKSLCVVTSLTYMYQNLPGLPTFASKVATKSLRRPGDEACELVCLVCCSVCLQFAKVDTCTEITCTHTCCVGLTSAVGVSTLQDARNEVGLTVTVVPEAYRARGPLGRRGVTERHRHRPLTFLPTCTYTQG